MAINERLIHTAAAAAADGGGTGNQEEGLILHLDANDVDSYDGDGSVWYDITNHEYTPAVDPAENFNTVLFSPASSGITSITGVGFQPDLVWTKNRDGTWFHQLYDSVRGGGKNLYTNDTYGENLPSLPTSHLDSFDSDGFTVDYSENIGHKHVAWCFKAGGAPTASNSGGQTPTSGSKMVDGTAVTDNYPTADIYPKKQSVNTKLGFSITEYDGAGSGKTLPHGLDAFPELYIIKTLDTTDNWWAYTVEGGDFQYLRLNGTNQGIDADQYYDRPTAELVEQGQTLNNRSVMYAFTSKRGVSKVGTYTGTGSSGNKVYTGFKPAFVMIKATNATDAWYIMDNKRDTSGVNTQYLSPNDTDAETGGTSGFTFTEDGFICEGTGNFHNASGRKFAYLAFAENTKETQLTPKKGDFVAEDTVTTGAELELDANDYSGSGNWLNTGDDSSGDGTISGASYTNDGTSDYFTFDGVDDEVTFSLSTFPNTTFTIEAWFYMTALPSSGNAYGVVAWGDEAAGERRSILVWNGGSGNPHVYFSGFGSSANIGGDTELSAGVWYHAAITVDSGEVNIYLNGVKDGSGSATLNSFTGTTGRIGNTGTDNEDFYGKIPIARVYDTVLTSAQIKANYDATYGLYQHADLELHLDPTSYSGSGTTWTADTGSDATVVASRYDEELGDSFDISTDSESTIVIPSGHPLNDNSFTLEFWFRSTEDWNNSGKGHYFIYEGSAAGWNFFYYEGLGWRLSQPVSTGYFGNNTVVTNKWHHVVLTYTGGTTKFYLDTKLLKTHSATRASSSLSAFDFGSTEAAAYKPKCLVGQIRMYSSALTADQVMQNYRFTKNDYPNGLNGTFNGLTSSDWNSSGYFDFPTGTDRIDLDFDGIDFNQTLVMWVNLGANTNADSNSTYRYYLYSQYTGSNYQYFNVNIYDKTGGVHINIPWRDSSGSYYFTEDDVDTDWNSGWNMVAVYIAGTESVYYSVNGNNWAQATLGFGDLGTENIIPTGNAMLSATKGNTSIVSQANPFSMSQLKVYDKVLTSSELSALNTAGYQG